MSHNLFGKLKYKERDERWTGYVPLSKFATVGMRPPESNPTEEEVERQLAELNLAMENMKNQLRERFGENVNAAFEEVERAAGASEEQPDEPPDPLEEERERRRAKRDQRVAARLAKGEFPISLSSPSGSDPNPQQEAAYRFLVANEQAVFDAAMARIWESFEFSYSQEYWRQIAAIKPAQSIADLAGRFALTGLVISKEARGDFSHLVFEVDSDWQDEHGLFIVYSPDLREAAWTTFEGLDDLTPCDDAEEDNYVPTPHDELLEAILTGDEVLARQLVAAGADVNALSVDEYPPLWLAVEHLEVNEVRLLLAFGADPSLANEDARSTPLKHAKKLYREFGFAPSKKHDPMLDAMMNLARETVGKQLDEYRLRLEAIIEMLEKATR